MDRRAVFFLVAAIMCVVLIPITEADERWVPIALSNAYTLLSVASWPTPGVAAAHTGNPLAMARGDSRRRATRGRPGTLELSQGRFSVTTTQCRVGPHKTRGGPGEGHGGGRRQRSTARRRRRARRKPAMTAGTRRRSSVRVVVGGRFGCAEAHAM